MTSNETTPVLPIRGRRSRSGRRTTPLAAPDTVPEPSVAGYLTTWLAGRQNLRPSTRMAYDIHIRRYLIPHLGHVALSSLTLPDVEAMYAGIATGSAISAATVQRIHATLMSALGSAVRRGLIGRNPALFVELARAPHPRMQVWTAGQLAQFLTCIRSDRLRGLFEVMAMTGLRSGEAVGLRWRDVDLDRGVLHVEQQIVAVGSERVVGAPKSSRGRRPVALCERLVEVLRVQASEQRWDQLCATTDWVPSGHVFTTLVGEPLDPAQVSRLFERLVAASGLPVLRLHDLRHCSATLGLGAGETLLEVSRRLGHSSITTTADIYSHVAPATALQSAERLDHLVNQFAMPTRPAADPVPPDDVW